MVIKVTFDSAKRAETLRTRGLDFADAAEVFGGLTFTFEDLRHDYGELRNVTAGLFHGRMVIVVSTPRGDGRHIISMRKANDRETARYAGSLGAD